jgi:hypothetical protein
VVVQSTAPSSPDVKIWVNPAAAGGSGGAAVGALDDLSDVSVAAATSGQILTKMPDGTWMGRAMPSQFWSGTLAQYNAIASKDPNTMYVVTG